LRGTAAGPDRGYFAQVRVGVVLGAAGLLFVGASSAQAASSDVVYRTSWQGKRYFHPLASFGKLNSALASGDRRRASRLASTLVARGTRERGTLVWRYNARRDGPATWESGLAQAVAAQSLARAGYISAARRAFRAIPDRLLIRLPEGPWIKLYGYSNVVVLNAQLQATLSIADYARLAQDAQAKRLARAMRQTTLVLLGRFDTGSWSRYSLNGADATLEYHEFVTSLLWKFARRTHGWRWRVYASRFRGYRVLAPRIRAGAGSRPFFPVPADGYRDTATVRFWLSKPATVKFRIEGQTWRGSFGRGWQRYSLAPRRLTPGVHDVLATATDRFGHTTWSRLQPVRVLRDVTPPRVKAELAPWQLYWRAADGESPWVALRLRIAGPSGVETVKLGRPPAAGTSALAVPIDPLEAVTLVATDSSGNQTWLPLETRGAPRLGAETGQVGRYTGLPTAA
jgi:D-glucuronyl C5-epimerase-like protein